MQTVSLIICEENFNFEFFNKELENLGVKDNFIDKNIEDILIDVDNYIKKYIIEISNKNTNDKNSENKIIRENFQVPIYIKCKCLQDLKVITYALTLFSRIEYSFFFKDMLIFYTEKIVPLLTISKHEIKKKDIRMFNMFIC